MTIKGLVDTATGAAVDPDERYAGASHSHPQSDTHGSADTDSATTALHHTLGTGANQAAAGNHTHTASAIGAAVALTDVAGAANDANSPAVNTRLVLDISGYTATRATTLPATFAVGDVVEVYVATGDDTYFASIVPASGDTIDGGTAGAEHTKLYIAGEKMRYRGVVANSAWTVEYDGRYRGSLFEVTHNGVEADRQQLAEATTTAFVGATSGAAAFRTVVTASPMFTLSTGVFRPMQAGSWVIEVALTIGPVGTGSSAIGYLQHSTDGTNWATATGQARLLNRQFNLANGNTPGLTGSVMVTSTGENDRWRIAVIAGVGVGGVVYVPAAWGHNNFARFTARRAN